MSLRIVGQLGIVKRQLGRSMARQQRSGRRLRDPGGEQSMLRVARLSSSWLSWLKILVMVLLLGKERRWDRGRLRVRVEGAAEGPQSVLENHSLRVALAFSLRFDAVVASRFLLATLDTALSTSWRLSTVLSMSTGEETHTQTSGLGPSLRSSRHRSALLAFPRRLSRRVGGVDFERRRPGRALCWMIPSTGLCPLALFHGSKVVCASKTLK
jgi:hypothetical protein